MADTNVFEEVMEEIESIMLEIKVDIDKKFKYQKPFGLKKLTPRQQLEQYQSKGFDIFRQIASEQGIDEATKYRDSMEKIKTDEIRRLIG